MPCDIGYKNISKITVKPPQPKTLKEIIKAPTADKELLENMGVDDLVFLEWVSGLDIEPLLKEALKRTLAVVSSTGRVEFSITGSDLTIESKYLDEKSKKNIEAIIKKVSERFQIETIRIIAELLDYNTVITERVINGNKSIVLEGEKNEEASVHKYLKVTIDQNNNGVLALEHFGSKASLKQEQGKFMVLAQKLGLKVQLLEEHESGQPIPHNVEHQHFIKHGDR